MAGEEFAWKMLKKGLNLSDEDVDALRDGVLQLKDMAPEMQMRAEITEQRVLALCLFCKDKDLEGWKRAERAAIKAHESGRSPG